MIESKKNLGKKVFLYGTIQLGKNGQLIVRLYAEPINICFSLMEQKQHTGQTLRRFNANDVAPFPCISKRQSHLILHYATRYKETPPNGMRIICIIIIIIFN